MSNETLLLQNILDRLDRIEQKIDQMITRRDCEQCQTRWVSRQYFAGVIAALTFVIAAVTVVARWLLSA